MPIITEIEDLRRLHKRRVPKMFFDYCESGSWTEQTFRDNGSDYSKIRLRQRVAVNMEGRSTASTLIGEPVAMPASLAPVGATGMQRADGRNPGRPRRRGFRYPLYVIDHVSLFDRGCGRSHQQTLLVPALRYA